MDYTFGDACLSLTALVRLDFDLDLNTDSYHEIVELIKSRYKSSCERSNIYYDERLIDQAESIEWQKIHGPF